MPVKLYLFFLIVLGLFGLSCEDLSNPGDIKYNNSILFNIKTGNSPQQLFVYNTLPLSYQFKDPPPWINLDEAFQTGAKITISGANQIYDQFQVSYTDSFRIIRCYTNPVEMYIMPDTEYKLRIESNNQIINGRITTIGDFEIVDLIQTTSEDTNTIYFNVIWNKCDRAKFYEISTTGFYSDSAIISSENGTPVWGLVTVKERNSFYIDADTLINKIPPYSANVYVPGQSDSMLVEVGAYDINTYMHLFEDIKKVGIENAYGYAGSSTVKMFKKILDQ